MSRIGGLNHTAPGCPSSRAPSAPSRSPTFADTNSWPVSVTVVRQACTRAGAVKSSPALRRSQSYSSAGSSHSSVLVGWDPDPDCELPRRHEALASPAHDPLAAAPAGCGSGSGTGAWQNAQDESHSCENRQDASGQKTLAQLSPPAM